MNKEFDIDNLPNVVTPELKELLIEKYIEFPKKNPKEWEKLEKYITSKGLYYNILNEAEKIDFEIRKKGRLTPEDLPEKLTDEIIYILYQMKKELPFMADNWQKICNILRQRGQLDFVIYEKFLELQQKEDDMKASSKTKEQLDLEKKQGENYHKYADKTAFVGNMGEPTGLLDYKEKYGVWPPGFDDRINPYELPEELSDEQIRLMAEQFINNGHSVHWNKTMRVLKKRNKGEMLRVFKKVCELGHGNLIKKVSNQFFEEEYGFKPPNCKDL